MKKIMIIILLVFLLIPIVSANLLYCLREGERLPPGCSGSLCRYICETTFCQVCTTDSGYPGVNPATCFDKTCSFLNPDDEVDTTPPQLTVNQPVNGAYYSSNRILFDIDVDALSIIEYKNTGEERWHTLCDNCDSYNKHITLNEGFNDIIIRVKKIRNNLISEAMRNFYIDTRLPMFIDSLPDNGEFANGEFIVKYTEENLDRVEFKYKAANENNWNSKVLNNCVSGQKQICSTTIDISPYENGEMDYQFLICDNTNCDEGEIKRVKVDSTAPILNINAFGASAFNIRNIPFDITVNEEVDLFYIDNNDPKHKHNKLCNDCTEFKGERVFRDGMWDITIYAQDGAGNFDSFSLIFFVDTKKPKIKKTIPSRGWANGDFTVIYDETNLHSISLFYGRNNNYREARLNGCQSGLKQECSIMVDLSAFDGGEVDVYWTITDNFFSISNKVKSFDVDVTRPSFNKLNYNIEEDKVMFDIGLSEEADIEYMDNAESTPKFRTLCSSSAVCNKSRRFKEGQHRVTIRATDEAGNFAEQEIQFTI